MSNAQQKPPPLPAQQSAHASAQPERTGPPPDETQDNCAKPVKLKRPKGAPKKSAHEKRSEVVRFRLTKSEKEALLQAAQKSNLTESDYVRYATIRIPPPLKSSKANPVDSSTLHSLHRIARELAPIGNNLNQIAHAANIGKTLSGKLTQSLEELERDLAEARRLMAILAKHYDR